jgi:hypothetical protein
MTNENLPRTPDGAIDWVAMSELLREERIAALQKDIAYADNVVFAWTPEAPADLTDDEVTVTREMIGHYRYLAAVLRRELAREQAEVAGFIERQAQPS